MNSELQASLIWLQIITAGGALPSCELTVPVWERLYHVPEAIVAPIPPAYLQVQVSGYGAPNARSGLFQGPLEASGVVVDAHPFDSAPSGYEAEGF